MKLGIYYTDPDEKEQYKWFFKDLYGNAVNYFGNYYIRTPEVEIYFIRDIGQLCGLRLDSYLILGGEENCPRDILSEFKLCSLF